MSVQEDNQQPRQVKILDLRDDVHEGVLTYLSVCTPSWVEELQLMDKAGHIDLRFKDTLEPPMPWDSALLVLGLERAEFSRNPLTGQDLFTAGDAFCILPQCNWPASDERFDDFFGSLRSLLGQKIIWQATISGTQSDPRLGRIIVQYGEANRRSFDLSREESPVSQKVSIPRI